MTPPSRFVNLDQARIEHGDAVDRLAPFLTRGDPLADAASEALAALPPPEVRRLVEALLDGAGEPMAMPAALRDLVDDMRHVPAWVDWATMQRGARVILRSGPLAGMVLAAKCIVLGYAAPAGNKPLMLAGGLVGKQAGRRLSETARYVRGVLLPDGLRDTEPGFRMTLHVRLMHAQVRRLAVRHPRWRSEAYGLPINQHDMAATTMLFSEALLSGLETLGFQLDHDEGEAVMHLWRYAGHLMGVDPELACATRREAQRLAALIDATQAPPDDDARALTAALFESDAGLTSDEPGQRKLAERRRELVRACATELLGQPLATQLGVQPSVARHALPLLRRFSRSASQLARASRRAEGYAIEVGTRYWDAMDADGLRRFGVGFMVPESLRR